MSIHDDQLRITTPENVAFGFPIAGIGSRFIAALVDTAAIAAIQIAVIVFGGLLAGVFMDGAGAIFETVQAWIIGVFGLVSFIFLWGYYIFFEMLWNGQTPGKRLAKLRVIRADGGPISLTESVVRNLIRLVDFLPLIYGLGVIVMFVDGKARRLGDLAAGTLVIREPDNRRAPSISNGRSSFQDDLSWIGPLPLEQLEPDDLALLESFLNRRTNLSDTTALERQIMARIYTRFQLPVPALDSIETVRLFRGILAAAGIKTGK